MPELRRDMELTSSASVQIVGEFTRAEFDKFLKNRGMDCRLTTHNMPHHNGVAESLERRLLDPCRLPEALWG